MVNKNSLSKELFNTLPLVFREIKKSFLSQNIPLAPNQIKILHLIHCHSITANELAKHFNVTPPTMSECIDGLLEKKLLKKVKSKKDRRVSKITLTDYGQKEMIKARKKIMLALDKKLNILTTKEKKILFEAINILQKTFSTNKN